ncbi:hypothetical protein F503_08671 [Ophiostoma piceae UAMH 11346]|uniref:Uncharacterized protein n=1 Tax=Ophiostoma piceae (strain UAMH 11346) TaxID=1262450 RepID=S3BRK9_OPHP1|nr:hypothetical protein F503_08671 [Ophiostoma piceae UAMH 11346]
MDIQRIANIWIYKLCTESIVDMVTPLGTTPTYGRDNQNVVLASILAWLEGITTIVGDQFSGWPIFTKGSLAGLCLSSACEATLYQTVKCEDRACQLLAADAYLGSTGNKTLTNLMCEASCNTSTTESLAAACAVLDPIPPA